MGEVRYWVGARLGRAHCALCDVTHGTFRRRSTWEDLVARLPVPFVTHHRDDAPADVLALGALPLVAARTDDGVRLVLGPDALAACAASVDAFAAALESAVSTDLRWPDAPVE